MNAKAPPGLSNRLASSSIARLADVGSSCATCSYHNIHVGIALTVSVAVSTNLAALQCSTAVHYSMHAASTAVLILLMTVIAAAGATGTECKPLLLNAV
jgi:hypothetical protein